MANFSSLKQAIETYIKQNGNKEITGALLQSILLSMVTTIGDGAVSDLESDVSDINSDISDINGALTASVQFTGGSLVFKNANDTVLYSIAVSTFLDGIVARLNSGAVYAGYAAPSTTPDTLAGQKVFYVATQAGTYIHFLYNGDTPITLAKDGIYFIVSGAGADDWNAEPIQQLDDVPTPNSNNPIKSGAVLRSIIQDGSAFDLSAHNAVGGVLATYADLSEALTALNSLDDVYKQPGMSFKFVLTSDNKYVQFRCIADEFTTDDTQWAITEEGVYVDNPEFVYVKTDSEGKILWAIKIDGTFYFGAGCPPQVKEAFATKVDKVEGKGLSTNDYTDDDKEIVETSTLVENSEYIQAATDSDDKILEGIKTDGTKVINIPIEVQGTRSEMVENPEWIDVKTDANDRIIEGINTQGEKHISKFDSETQEIIKDFVGTTASVSETINIPILDANFTSPVPVIITGDKGDDNAKYEFELPLSNDAFNIRFKFKITENILNQNKSSVIAKIGNANAIYTTIQALSQLQSSVQYSGETKIMYWPSLRGGIRLNGSSVSRTTGSVGNKQNIGNFAFYVAYVGESTNVTIENNGQAFIIGVDGVETVFSFVTYPTVPELYEAIKLLPDFEVSYNEIESRLCSELAIFSECVLVSKYYTGIDGTKTATIVEYYDSAPFLVPYAVSEEWHQAEIVKVGGNVYASCDGTVVQITPSNNTLILGGDCGCLFKELLIDTTSSGDAEVVDGQIISSANPNIIIHEGHNIIETPTCEIIETSGNIGTTVDRLQLVYSKMISKGYVPVSINEIADYYAGNRNLPKRCFTSIFDDYRWVNCLDLNNRAVFTRLGILPVLAIITSNIPSTILHNGSEITIQQASVICRNYRFGLVSHTRNHRDNQNIKPSTYISEFTADVYDGDIKGIDNSIIVYPYGHVTEYLTDVLRWLGFRLGVNIIRGGYNIKNRNRCNLTRVDISVNTSINDILEQII